MLENQNRNLWDQERIKEGVALVERALAMHRPAPYALQAAIAALHAEAPSAAQTDWPQIVALYDVLAGIDPSPVVELNRAVAVAMRDGPQAGLQLIQSIMKNGELEAYHLAHAAQADLYRRLGKKDEAAKAYKRALALSKQEPERRFLERRLAEMSKPGGSVRL